MKNIKYCICLLLISMIYSCDLASEIYNEIIPDNFPKNEKDLEAMVTPMYAPFYAFSAAAGQANGVLVATEMTTDIGQCAWGDAYWGTLLYQEFYPQQNELTNQFFTWYNYISKGTLLINRIEESSVSVSDKVKQSYIAQVKCARGWLAYILYNLYGPVPVADLKILLNPKTEVILERPTDEWMVEFIETNLTEAINGGLPYPTEQSADDWGRFNKGLANMVLLKLYMMEKRWDDAVRVARELMKPEYGYSLMQSYADIFTLENERNSEIIYAVPCTYEAHQTWHPHVLPADFPTENSAIQKWGGYKVAWKFYDTFEQGDKRLARLYAEYISTDGIKVNRNNPGVGLERGAIPMKYGEDPKSTGIDCSIDWIFYRYADVILLLAEALNNQNSGPLRECYVLVNSVRERTGLKLINVDAPGAFQVDLVNGQKKVFELTTQSGFNEFILSERGHELWFEGCRRDDLIRHGKYYQAITEKELYTGKSKPGYERFPIPESIIIESKGKVVQNEAYK